MCAGTYTASLRVMVKNVGAIGSCEEGVRDCEGV